MRFAQDALGVLLDALQVLPDSPGKGSILEEARECERSVERWRQEPPSVEQNERVMQRILELHIATARLQRASREGSP